MKKFTSMIIAMAAVILIAGCATTNTTTFRDPEYGNKSYSKICVLADLEDLEWRGILEKEIVDELAKYNVYALRGSNIIVPTRDWTDEEIQKTLMDKNFDGCLYISLSGKYIKENYHSGSTTTETKKEKEKKDGKTVYSETTTTTYEPPFTTNTFYNQLTSKLIDVKTSKIAWLAYSKSQSGTVFQQSENNAVESAAEDIVEWLLRDRMLYSRRK